MLYEIPRQGRPLPFWPLLSFCDTDPTLQSDVGGSVSATVRQNPDLMVPAVVVLGSEIVEQPVDDSLFVMSGDHHPKMPSARPHRNGLRIAPTEGSDDQVVGDEGDQECFDGAEQNS